MIKLRVPVATYRLQFNSGFRFEDARAIVPYLRRLGISDIYASPIFKARQGSPHGYDVTDPTYLNPELGREQDFEALAGELKAHGMGFLLDIVPNHMAASPENPWWMDLLENGPGSPYSNFFDIDWDPVGSVRQNKVLLPILDSPYRQVLENQGFTLTLEEAGLFVYYHDFRLPLDIKSYALVLSHRLVALESVLGADHPVFRQFKQLIDAMEHLPPHTRPEAAQAQQRRRERQAIKEELLHLINSSPEAKAFLLENVALFNGEKGVPQSFDLLDRLLAQQAYQLAFWKTALEEINYRRFFDISDLIGVRVEELQVFETTHDLVFRLTQEGNVTGLRIDHIDGLHDPLQYLRRLQHRIAPKAEASGKLPGFYIVVEKILTGDEALPEEWPVFGTTGYDFLNTVNTLFVDGKGIQDLEDIYARFTGSQVAFEDVIYEKKKQVIEELFPGEVHALGHQLVPLAQQDRYACDLSWEELTKGLIEVTACLPVYRTYTRTLEVSPLDRPCIERSIEEARRRVPALEASVLDFLKRVLLLDFPASLAPDRKEAWLRFVMRWQQFTSAVMAKGFEDTALYTYNRLVSLNEVGGDPRASGLSVEAFHRRNMVRQTRWPYALSATSTHDTKRGEDVRARINVLSEIPEAWGRHLTQWSRWNQAKKGRVNGQLVPDSNLEALLYQTLVGAWPFSEGEVSGFKERLKAYMVKAAREAKLFTSWLSLNLEYEDALLEFVESILETCNENKFLDDLLRFQSQVAYYGALNSLAQVLLKIASPGVPDFYQGTELWDLSLVDPDNRRPVDFGKRMRLLNDLIRQEAQGQLSLVGDILTSWEDGRVKLYVTYKALGARTLEQDMFLRGDYIPLQIRGQRQEHICAFARCHGKKWALIVVPRLLTKLVRVGMLPLGRRVWDGDVLLLPESAPERWLHVFTQETLRVLPARKELPLSSIFRRFPVALLVGLSQE
jgi:(1->4)-alpha-D-glucan 1-alpha-D-glucosylmutase